MNEPIADVVARVLAIHGPYLGGQDIYPSERYTESASRADAVTLAREVERLTEERNRWVVQAKAALDQEGAGVRIAGCYDLALSIEAQA